MPLSCTSAPLGALSDRAVIVVGSNNFLTTAPATTATLSIIVPVIAHAITTATLSFLIRGFSHRGGLGHGFVHSNDQVTQHRVAETESTGELVQDLLVALDVHQNVVRLVDLGDGISELATAPVFEAMHAAFTGGDHALVTLD